MPSVLIIDRSLLVRQGLRHILGNEYRDLIFGEAEDVEEALAQPVKHAWDLVILDVSAFSNDSLASVGKFCKFHPLVPVLVMSAKGESLDILRTQRMGAKGQVCKDATRSSLVKAIRDVFAGKTHFERVQPPETTGNPELQPARLSPRENLVMLALADGKRITDIAAEFKLSIKTVSTYKRRILIKLQLKSIADLVRYLARIKSS